MLWRTKFDESVWPGNALYLRPIQVDELCLQLLKILVGQLLGVALLCEGQVADVCIYDVMENKVPAVHRHPAVVRLLHCHFFEQCLQHAAQYQRVKGAGTSHTDITLGE